MCLPSTHVNVEDRPEYEPLTLVCNTAKLPSTHKLTAGLQVVTAKLGEHIVVPFSVFYWRSRHVNGLLPAANSNTRTFMAHTE